MSAANISSISNVAEPCDDSRSEPIMYTIIVLVPFSAKIISSAGFNNTVIIATSANNATTPVIINGAFLFGGSFFIGPVGAGSTTITVGACCTGCWIAANGLSCCSD